MFRGHCDKLLQRAFHDKMHNLLYEMQIFLERPDEAADTAIKLAKDERNPSAGLRHVRNALKSVSDALKIPVEQWNGGIPRARIETYAKLLPLQKRFFEFCASGDFGNVSELTLFSGVPTAEAMVVFLFRHMQCTLATDIIKVCGLGLTEITRRLGDMLLNEEDSQLGDFMKTLEIGSPDAIFRSIVHEMLIRVNHVREGLAGTLVLVQKYVSNPEFRCMLMLEFGELDESYRIAKRENLWAVMPIIGQVGSRAGNFGLCNEVQKDLIAYYRRFGQG
jgi:hypothetical protein